MDPSENSRRENKKNRIMCICHGIYRAFAIDEIEYRVWHSIEILYDEFLIVLKLINKSAIKMENFTWVRTQNCGCLVTWFYYQLIAKPGNKTAAVSWPTYRTHGLCMAEHLSWWPWRDETLHITSRRHSLSGIGRTNGLDLIDAKLCVLSLYKKQYSLVIRGPGCINYNIKVNLPNMKPRITFGVSTLLV